MSSLPSIRSCVWLELVLAENTMNSGVYCLGRWRSNLFAIVKVLPVPVGPMHSTCTAKTKTVSLEY